MVEVTLCQFLGTGLRGLAASTSWLAGSPELPFMKSNCAGTTKLERPSVGVSINYPSRAHSFSHPNIPDMWMKPSWILQIILAPPQVTSADATWSRRIALLSPVHIPWPHIHKVYEISCCVKLLSLGIISTDNQNTYYKAVEKIKCNNKNIY